MKNDTPNTPDERLDSLFRQAAAGYEPAFDPEAWKAMEQKLDGPSDRPGSIWKNRLLEGLVVLGLLGGLGWFGAGRLSEKKQPETAQAGREQKQAGTSIPRAVAGRAINKRGEKIGHAKPAEADITSQTGEKPVTDAGSTATDFSSVPPERGPDPGVRATERKSRLFVPGTNRQTTEAVSPEKKTQIGGKSGAADKSADISNNSLTTTELTLNQKQKIHTRNSLSAISEPRPSESLPASVSPVAIDTNRAAQLSIYLLKTKPWQPLPVTLGLSNPGLSNPSVESAPEVIKPVSVTPERWALQLMLSPDFTRVPGRPASSGINTGLQLDYRFAPRWRASAGVIYSLKKYGASSYDYRPYDGYWQTYHRPDNIDATCKMLDIPVAVTFDAWKVRKNTFFVSVGSTSYILLKENYLYEYQTYDRMIEKYNGGSNWLATANFSVGLERPIGPRLTLRAEPFVKLPLGTLGFGNVRLRTEGLFFSLRYRLKSAGR